MVTLYCTSMLWPPSQSVFGLLYILIFSTLSSLTLYHFFSALCIGPGYIPPNWRPEEAAACSQLQFCSQCECYKAPRSHHCRRCGRCVMKMDHHCPWINTCVGHFNHGHFVGFLASAVTGCSMATVSLTLSLYYGLNRTWYLYYGTGLEPQVILTLWSLLGENTRPLSVPSLIHSLSCRSFVWPRPIPGCGGGRGNVALLPGEHLDRFSYCHLTCLLGKVHPQEPDRHRGLDQGEGGLPPEEV